jgi:aspartyl-tRNA(Asn)/glutamyl-tRNA(Gln) amidotransferase subunit A
VLRDEALAAAARANEAPRSPLHGIPIGLRTSIKRGIRTTAGSPRYLDHVPDEDRDLGWVARRRGILLGKRETHEFAIGGPDFTCRSRPRASPWNTAHIRRIIERLGGRGGGRAVRRGDGIRHRRLDPWAGGL